MHFDTKILNDAEKITFKAYVIKKGGKQLSQRERVNKYQKYKSVELGDQLVDWAQSLPGLRIF